MAIFIYKILHTGNNFYFDFKEVQTNDEVKKKKKKKKSAIIQVVYFTNQSYES
jgi:hypothetical protein